VLSYILQKLSNILNLLMTTSPVNACFHLLSANETFDEKTVLHTFPATWSITLFPLCSELSLGNQVCIVTRFL